MNWYFGASRSGEPICWGAAAPNSCNEPLKRRRSPCSFRRPWDARDSPRRLGCREGRLRPRDDPDPLRSQGRAKRPPHFQARLNSAPRWDPLPLDASRGDGGDNWALRPRGPPNRIMFDGPQLSSPQVGARLLHFSHEWERLTTDVYVRSVIREGYRIELSDPPPLSHVPIPMRLPRGTDHLVALRREVMALLYKGAIEELHPLSLTPGFYSRIFLVPKKDGGFRPVFDLKALNAFVVKEKFKMTTPRVVTNALHEGDWAVSIDLKDAYFHVPIHVRSRRLLRFALDIDNELRIFQFKALPFGLTSAPRVFTKVILPVGQSAHMRAVCLLQYLDDWLLRSPDKLLLARQTSWLLDVIRRLGFILNVPKSQLIPTQRLTHIGVEYHLDVGLMFPPMERVHKFEGKIRVLLAARVTTAYFWLSLLGLLSSATDAIPLGRLHLRPLQLYLLAHWAPVTRNLQALIPVKHDLLDHHLHWWLDRKCTRAGTLLDVPEARTQLFTDASESGWGAHLDTAQASGVWSAEETSLHINHLELLAVYNALIAFRNHLNGMTIQLMSDNSTVVSYLVKQGGTVSVPLYLLTRKILLLAQDAHITIRAKHIPGERNALADLLSRKNKVVHTEWTLLQTVVDSLCITWGTPNVDLFATRLNNRLPVFVSPMADPRAVDIDALSIPWKGMYAYAFPPFVMLGRVIEKILRDHPCEMILVAPKWPNQSWYARLMELLVDFPLVLPYRNDLLTQPHNHQRHQSLQAVALHAWRLSSDPSKQEAFRRRLPHRSPGDDVSHPALFMTASGESSLVGVLNGRWILSKSTS